jgi:hypothetical protein
MTHGSQVVCQGRVERELAAGCDPVYFNAEPDGVKQMQVGRLDVDEFLVTHDFSLGRLQPERDDSKDGSRSCGWACVERFENRGLLVPRQS